MVLRLREPRQGQDRQQPGPGGGWAQPVGFSPWASALVVAATVLGAMASFIDRIGQATQHQLH
jgi:hypothetical protein